MSKVDTTFDFAAPLIAEWGQPAQLITKGNPTYDINTGETVENEIVYNVNIVITSLDITETGGLYQANDIKILIDPVQINYIYLTEADYFLVPRDGAPDQYMKIIEPKTYRGDKPVFYNIVARPQ
jgi:hypothetical protein